MKIQLLADDGQTVMGSATIPAGTAAVLAQRFPTMPEMLAGMLVGLNNVIDAAVEVYPPADVQAAEATAATAAAALVATSQAYRAVQD
jgi:hypothetical protein